MITFSHQTRSLALLAAQTLIPVSLVGASIAPWAVSQTSERAFALSRESQISSSAELITEDSIGPVRLGMTVAQVVKVFPGAKLSRTSDGEGLALIAVERGGKTLMTLYAGETNNDAGINERAVIEFVEVWDKSYHTSAGVHPQMPLHEVERKYGKLQEIVLSEIESREYATFGTQPAGINLRVMNENGMAGVYAEDERRTTRFAPSAYVFSISISRAQDKAARFSSSYTDLITQCKNPAGRSDEGQHTSLFCRGSGIYRIHIFDSAMALHITAETLNSEISIQLADQSLTWEREGRRVEWRLADDKPFAVILRVFKYSGQGQYPLQEKPTAEVLVIKGLEGYENIDAEVDVKTASDPNVRARELADDGYAGAVAKPKRNEGESLESFARRIIPSGSKLAYQPLEGNFGPSTKSILILFSGGRQFGYQGWVLVPAGDGFEKHVLARPEYIWSIEEPQSVFYANANRDPDLELFILSECYIGIGPNGAEPFHRTRVYDWTGSGFAHLDAVSERIGSAATAAQVRKRIVASKRKSRK